MKDFKVMNVLTWGTVWPLVNMDESETREIRELGGIYFDLEEWRLK